MSDNYAKVREFVVELGFRIDEEIPEEEIVIVNDEERGVRNLVIDCEDSVLVIEQLILKFERKPGTEVFRTAAADESRACFRGVRPQRDQRHLALSQHTGSR